MKKIICVVIVFIVYSPELFSQNLSWKSNDIHLDFKNQQLSTTLPTVEWTEPRYDFSSSVDGKVQVDVTVTSEVELTSVTLSVIDTKTNEVYATRSYTDVKGKSYTVKRMLTLVEDGVFRLELTAANQTGGTVSGKRSIVTGKDAREYISTDRKDYALIFATDKYDYWDDLVNPVNDAQTLAKELREKYGFETEIVENADYEEVFEKLRDYNERSFNPQDQLLIFFAGHGLFDDTFGEGYVVAKNSLANDKARTSYISHARLRGIIDNIPCRHVMLMMDVCFGGTLDPVIARARGAVDEVSEREMLARKFSYKTRKYLTSGGKEYVSDGIPGKHSPFAAKLIESLRSFGGDDRILTLSELQANMEKLKQVPRFGSFGEDEKLSDFVFVAKDN
ncbi:MAG: caspase family protein [Cyclobacteriaceae bacterium]|nr:caspase family protein [Cyclobacteriaceae bacterium]